MQKNVDLAGPCEIIALHDYRKFASVYRIYYIMLAEEIVFVGFLY